MKNIVVCCDGTGNEYGEKNSNVVKLFSILNKDPRIQTAFYDPGVGTLSAPNLVTVTARRISRALGLAFGYGIMKNIGDAYRFIMETYEPEDRVFIFGFSRGAYTARGIAALLRMCGLLEAHNENLIPYALKMLRQKEPPFKISPGFTKTFSRECDVHLLGLWDTVSSVGWVTDPVTMAYTRKNSIVKAVRHAISIDERRAFFRQNLWGDEPAGNVKQVWFAGVHSDVGGSYPECESGLSKITLQWMIDEAVSLGLKVDPELLKKEIPERLTPESASPKEDEECNQDKVYKGNRVSPTWRGKIHTSLKGPWKILEYFPKPYKAFKDGKWVQRAKIYRGRPRFIEEGSTIHWSAIRRMQDPEMKYNPKNLPEAYEEESPSKS